MAESGTSIHIQWDDFTNTDVHVILNVAGLSLPVADIPQLVERVKQYLQVNRISNYVFASKVLNVTSCYFSTMLSSKEELKWESISKKQQVCFARIQYWMDHRATYGNNVHSGCLESGRSKGKGVGHSRPRQVPMKRPRTLLQSVNRTALIDVAASNIDLGDEFTKEVVVNEVNNNRDFHFESNPMETGEVNKKNFNTISIYMFFGNLL